MTFNPYNAITQVIDLAKFDASQDFALGEHTEANEKLELIKSVEQFMTAVPALYDLCVLWEHLASKYLDISEQPLFQLALSMTRNAIRKAQSS